MCECDAEWKGQGRILLISLVYTVDYLPGPKWMALAVVLECPRLIVLGDFNVHVEALKVGPAQVFMVIKTIMDLSPQVEAPLH